MTPKPRALAGRRVLLVEDDYFIAVDLKSGFEEGGAQVLGPVASVDAAPALIAGTYESHAPTGRAACRGRGCRTVYNSVGGVSSNTKHRTTQNKYKHTPTPQPKHPNP
ncbi:hypothetical protein CCS92_33810, partial [Methylobacterium radiotolerans]